MLSEMKVDENFEIRHSTKINNTILDTTEQQTWIDIEFDIDNESFTQNM